MISSPYAIAIREASSKEYSSQEIDKIIISLESDSSNTDFSKIPYQHVASSIHSIFLMAPPKTRSFILRIVCELQINSAQNIIEKYHFDKLIALSIDQKLPDPPPKFDDEKAGAFRAVAILLTYCLSLPSPIIYAMINLFHQPKNNYRSLIVSYFLEAIIHQPSIADIPEVSQILLDFLMETGSPVVSQFLCYSIEHNYSFIRQNLVLKQLISPLAQFAQPPISLPTACEALKSVLRTWPGFLIFGIQQGGLIDLLRCLPHQSGPILDIFSSFIRFSPEGSVTDSFNGFFYFVLMKLGFRDESLPQTAEFTSNRPFNFLSSHSSDFAITYPPGGTIHYSQAAESPNNIVSVQSFSLPLESSMWDWRNITKLLNVILAHNSIEANSQPAVQFYSKLIDCFATQLLGANFQRVALMDSSLHSLSLLMLKTPVIWPILEVSSPMQVTMEKTIQAMGSSTPIEAKSPYWSIFELLSIMMQTTDGGNILTKWDFIKLLVSSAENSQNAANASKALELVKFNAQCLVPVVLFGSFLRSSSGEVHAQTLCEIKKKSSEPFFIQCFEKVLCLHIQELDSKKDEHRLSLALNLLCELMITNQECLDVIVGSPQMYPILMKHSRPIYSLLFSRETFLKAADVKEEVKWWIESESRNFVKAFDRAVEFTMTKCQISGSATLTEREGFARIPPHLFRELGKSRMGVELLKPFIPSVVEKLDSKSKKEKRAALLALGNLGASNKAIEALQNEKVLEKMFACAKESESLMIRGTFISAISMFCESPYLSRVLQANKFEVFRFGARHCVVPSDPSSFTPEKETEKYPTDVNTTQPSNGFIEMLNNLASPFKSKKAKEDLKASNRERPSELLIPKLSLYGQQMIGSRAFTPESRYFVEVLFKNTPMMELDQTPMDASSVFVVRARISELLSQQSEVYFSVIAPKTFSPKDARAQPACQRFPEAFLSDDDFQASMGASKQEFLRLPLAEQRAKRQNFLNDKTV